MYPDCEVISNLECPVCLADVFYVLACCPRSDVNSHGEQ